MYVMSNPYIKWYNQWTNLKIPFFKPSPDQLSYLLKVGSEAFSLLLNSDYMARNMKTDGNHFYL